MSNSVIGTGGGGAYTVGTWSTPTYVVDVTQKKEMSVAEQVVKQRADMIERARVEKVLDEFGAAWTVDFEEGAVLAWDDDVAVLTEAGWRSSERSAPSLMTTEKLITWLVEHKIDVGDITILR